MSKTSCQTHPTSHTATTWQGVGLDGNRWISFYVGILCLVNHELKLAIGIIVFRDKQKYKVEYDMMVEQSYAYRTKFLLAFVNRKCTNARIP